MSSIEERIAKLGIQLPTPTAPVANYLPAIKTNNSLIISGQLPFIDGKLFATGKLGATIDLKTGQQAARYCMINILAQAKAAIGQLNEISKLIRLGGISASIPEFTQQAVVMNGASDLAVEIFGDKGRHARSAFGVACLPMDACVEVEAWFELK